LYLLLHRQAFKWLEAGVVSLDLVVLVF